jgi:hypothetical protein
VMLDSGYVASVLSLPPTSRMSIASELTGDYSAESADSDVPDRIHQKLKVVWQRLSDTDLGLPELPRLVSSGKTTDMAWFEFLTAARLLPFHGEKDALEDSRKKDRREDFWTVAGDLARTGQYADLLLLLEGMWIAGDQRHISVQLEAEARAGLGQWRAALSLHSAVLSREPKNVSAALGSIECLVMLGKFTDSADMIDQFIALNEDSPWAWQRCGRSVTRLGESKLTVRFDAAMKLCFQPGDPDWVGVRALWLMRTGLLERVHSLLSCFAAGDFHNSPVLHQAFVEQALRSGKWDDAHRLVSRKLVTSTNFRDYCRRIEYAVKTISTPSMQVDFLNRIRVEIDRSLNLLMMA